MTTTYRHAGLHTARAVHHLSQLVSEFGPSEPAVPVPGRGLRARVTIDGVGVTLAAGRAGAVPASRRGDNQGTIVVEAPDRESLTQAEASVDSHLHRLAGPDPLTLAWSDPVRPATVADDPALLALDRRSWDETSSNRARRAPERPTFFSRGGRSPNGLLVAERDGALVGMVKVHPKSPFPESAHVFAVLNLVVAPEIRRQGVATVLLTVAEHVARERGARTLSLMVRGVNQPAIRLYADHGYVIEERFPHVDDLSLIKTIDAPGA